MHIWTVALTFGLDQLTKYLIIFNLELGERIAVMPFFNIVHFKNKGAAFGMFHDASPAFRLVLFSAITIACLIFLVWMLGTSPVWDKFHRFCLALILGGALGNVKDRLIFQQVTDFLDVYYKEYHWPAFNIADSAISVGVTLLILRYLPWRKAIPGLKKAKR